MAREILHIAGLEKTTPEFRRELIAVADRQGLDPSYLAAVISFETGHTFDATKANPYSGCVGLIQFCMPSTVGTTRSELLQMSPIEQLEYVEKHYAMVDPKKRVCPVRQREGQRGHRRPEAAPRQSRAAKPWVCRATSARTAKTGGST
jgi:hypothetical protein